MVSLVKDLPLKTQALCAAERRERTSGVLSVIIDCLTKRYIQRPTSVFANFATKGPNAKTRYCCDGRFGGWAGSHC